MVFVVQSQYFRTFTVTRGITLTITHYLYKEVLLREYGVEFIDYGCLETDELDQRIRGYNEVSRAAIEERFGAGVIEKVFQQVSEDIHTY